MDTLLGWLNPMWVVEQFMIGNGLPFLLWTAIVAIASYKIGKKRQEYRMFGTDQFTPRQLHVIYECYRASFDKRGYLVLDNDNNEVASLSKDGVVHSSERASLPIGENGKRKQAVRLTPSWYRYVKRHERKFKKLYEKSEKMVDWKTK